MSDRASHNRDDGMMKTVDYCHTRPSHIRQPQSTEREELEMICNYDFFVPATSSVRFREKSALTSISGV